MEALEYWIFDFYPLAYDIVWTSMAALELMRRRRHLTAGWLYVMVCLLFCGYGGGTMASLVLGQGLTVMHSTENLVVIALTFCGTLILRRWLNTRLWGLLSTPLQTMSGVTCIIANYARAATFGLTGAPLVLVSSFGGFGSGVFLAYEDRMFSKRLLRSEFTSLSIKYACTAAFIFHTSQSRLACAAVLVFFQTTRSWGIVFDPLEPLDQLFHLLTTQFAYVEVPTAPAPVKKDK